MAGALFAAEFFCIFIGLQFTTYSKYNGAAHNYDGAGRNVSDNNSLFLDLWGAY